MSRYEKVKKLVKQPSTWRGIAALAAMVLGGAGVVDPDSALYAFGTVYGLINIFRNEDKE